MLSIMVTASNERWDMDNHMGGGWWWVMGIGWLVFLGLIVLVVVFVMRQSADRGQGTMSRGAEDVLAERLARGEIDEDEYRRRRDALRN